MLLVRGVTDYIVLVTDPRQRSHRLYCLLGVGSKNSPKTRKNTPKWVKISPKSPQNPPENGFGGGSGQFSALISGKTSKIVVKFRGGGVLRIDPYYTPFSFKPKHHLGDDIIP